MRTAPVLFVAGLALSLFGAVPLSWFPVASGRMTLFALGVGLAALAFVIGGGAFALARSAKTTLFAGLLLPAVYALSWYFSIDRSVGLLGNGVETDTLVFVLLCFTALALGIGCSRHSRSILFTVLGVAVVATLFQLISIFIGIPLEFFADKSANLVGKWNDLGVFAGLLLLSLTAGLEWSPLSTRFRYLSLLGIVVVLVLLAFVQFPLVWEMLLGGAILVAVLKFLKSRSESGTVSAPASWKQSTPWISLAVGAVAVVFLVFGTAINTRLSTLIPVAALEVRPAFSSTLDVGKAAHAGSLLRALVGQGPNTFTAEWLLHKPVEVNQSQFWNIDFIGGFSTLSSAFTSVGVFGVVAWLLPLFLVLVGAFRLFAQEGFRTRPDVLIVGLAGVYLWVAFGLYALSPVLVLALFALSGAFLGAVSRARGEGVGSTGSPSMMRLWGSLFAVLLVVVPVFVAAEHGRRFGSLYYLQASVSALGTGETDAAAALLARSRSVETTGDNLRFGVEVALAKMAKIAQGPSEPADEIRAAFQAAVTAGVSDGQAAAALNPRDYRPYAELAALYEALASLKVQGALEGVMGAYREAAVRNPQNPAVPLLMARAEAGSETGTIETVVSLLGQSLTLKPNYTDALLFAVQLAVAQNDLAGAIQAQTAAVSSASDQAPLWFQLGLLYYVGNDMEKAVAALEQAITMVPDYANAKYFLGLAYYRQDNKEGALQQFTGLRVSNPNNAEVKLILENLQAGKEPLEGARPPADTPPEDRTSAPLTE